MEADNHDLGRDFVFRRNGRDFLLPPEGRLPGRLPEPPAPFFEALLFKSGTLPSQIALRPFFVNRRLTMNRSRLVTNEIATPFLPIRPVRPVRCT